MRKRFLYPAHCHISLHTVTLFIWLLLTTPIYAQSPSLFTDVSDSAGIGVNRYGREDAIGQAWGDYDGDGWLDLYVTDHAGPNTLYHNNGDGTFSLSPLNQTAALPDAHSGGASFIDYDNDGWRDLYVLNWGENVLFRNIGGGQFVDVTADAGVAGNFANSQTASWGDYDQDGWLDLYVANWACFPDCGRPATGDADRLYRNNGDGTFTNVTRLLSSKILGAGFVASFTDYDNDGDLDIYLVNDEFINPVGNALWRNDGAGCDSWCFTEVSAAANADTAVMGMGLATADYDNDGDLDFYFTNAGPMTLLQNQGDGTFADVAAAVGVNAPGSTGWATVFLDYDNDGWQDVYLAVSDVTDGERPTNRLYHNMQNGVFADVSAGSGADHPGETLGIATADYNQDGKLDMVIGSLDTGYRLLRNDAPTDHHWYAIDLIGTGTVNRDAVGSRVFVTTPDGITQMQEVIAGSSLGAGEALTRHFGLGNHTRITQLRVVWPDGIEQLFENVAADQAVSLVMGEDAPTVLYALPPSPPPAPPYRAMAAVIGIVGLLLFYLSTRNNAPPL